MTGQKPKPPPPVGALLKPKLDTKFHIDYSWWENNDIELRSYLLSHLPPEQREAFQDVPEGQVVDYVDPETGEVFQLDALGMALKEAATAEDFINAHVSLVDCVFRVFLTNGNTPLTPTELEEATGRPAATILRTLGGIKVYQGLRPVELS